jgi:hypothetical protein
LNRSETSSKEVTGEFLEFNGERYYLIGNVDKMAPFFISVISNVDHWLFVSSTGGLTAGRVSPETALFPYVTVDKIHESTTHTGSKTMLRVTTGKGISYWEPFDREQDGHYELTRNLYKNTLGNKLCFEEINHDLQLVFRYTWVTSDTYGFVRQCELKNLGDQRLDIDLVDGLQNILPAGTPRFAQTNTSNLVDAYKWTELDAATGLALFTLYSGISDRAEPCESLKANTAFCLGLDNAKVLISSGQLNDFRVGTELKQEAHRRGIRGAYLVSVTLNLAANSSRTWQIVADTELTQAQVVDLLQQLRKPSQVEEAIARSVAKGSDDLARIMARADSCQSTAEEIVSAHHYANVLFNVLRGGIFDNQYIIPCRDFARTIKHFNRNVYRNNLALFDELPDTLKLPDLLERVTQTNDAQLKRLCQEYLPIRFGRRHGDPSRPWNQFAIKLKDASGNHLLSYQGNWRDIFQNWEALTFSYPGFIESVIAKFVNASTVDGYNPYRITKDGIDWEVEEPDDPWSYIGYWGDHQIIYLLKLLELSRRFHSSLLGELLYQPIFCYANVPYRIKPFDALLKNSKSTVVYDKALAAQIEQRIAEIGADGKLVLDPRNNVYLVNLLEKLLVTLLCRLGNLVIDGGIWMNTQRPEWNDANNALVGQGLSMVTLCYLRRYVCFLQKLLDGETCSVSLSTEVSQWLSETTSVLATIRPLLGGDRISTHDRYATLVSLGQASSRYRQAVYGPEPFSGTQDTSLESIRVMLGHALAVIDHSIKTNRREDGLYHAYNLLNAQEGRVEINNLYPMLEGQVAVLSAGAISAKETVAAVEALFNSDVYRPDQHSFMLYPDRQLPGFLEKNRIPEEEVEAIPVLQRMLKDRDTRIVLRDVQGCYRFNAELTNVGKLNEILDLQDNKYSDQLSAARKSLQCLYEKVFDHQTFTGRSGTMFAFEGLGSIYWHMVSKLLLALQENYFTAVEKDEDAKTCRQLGRLYYRVREGLGFNKTPAAYGAFPADPYSHTPQHAGASQPGMTGQVKEEVLSRFGELGVQVHDGAVRFEPGLLRSREFVSEPRQFRYLDIEHGWEQLTIPAGGLAFTWCQVPVVYQLQEGEPTLVITWSNGDEQAFSGLTLSPEASTELFQRSGKIRQLSLKFGTNFLFKE